MYAHPFCKLIFSPQFYNEFVCVCVCVCACACVCVCVYKLKQINLYLQYSVTISDDDILAVYVTVHKQNMQKNTQRAWKQLLRYQILLTINDSLSY